MPTPVSRRVVIGVGNPDRGDDAAGREVAQLLLQRDLHGDFSVLQCDGEATAVLDCLDGAASAVLIDACQTGAPAGTVHRFDVSLAPLPQVQLGLSTHGLGLAEAIELARALGKLPPCCVVYAIEGNSFERGAPLTPAVRIAAACIVERLITEIIGRE